MRFIQKHKQSVKSAGWGIAGLIISISIIQTRRISLFGYPLLILSALMFLLAAKQFIEENQLLNICGDLTKPTLRKCQVKPNH